MTTALYQLCHQVFPELVQVPEPTHPHNFYQFMNWSNTLHSNIQYVELKEYYDNGTDKCYQLQQAQVDIEQLNNRIEAEVEQLFAEYTDTTADEQNEIDFAEHIYAILFNNIYAVAEQHGLALLLISNENPYWMLVPDLTEQIDRLIEAFNATFSDVELYHYV
ncbi:hypothetical protein F909_00353 [Acinetobacter sp. ANC 3929]|uniref:hypothetical protein n=1 Tax=unclassified Acinetobacter TaxID=196816 RepID=UPI0002CF3F33|nr:MULTISPECIES: hypothetical protein [unclassified Acinetobacter]ENW83692.1 hypothetical protein F909_00353 [Acinetobacter sp. ANC 3929]MCH7353531.1 hypothetical protein [Acinetobacter sp. NIPH 2023]MCH7355968.1 hypothetical protein [Acinetobacter sp. NIPH 1958]MCH7360854.1 hypothetical protein [Acinetobacter sp. NIPH 2024]